jgi:hypothetical protein
MTVDFDSSTLGSLDMPKGGPGGARATLQALQAMRIAERRALCANSAGQKSSLYRRKDRFYGLRVFNIGVRFAFVSLVVFACSNGHHISADPKFRTGVISSADQSPASSTALVAEAPSASAVSPDAPKQGPASGNDTTQTSPLEPAQPESTAKIEPVPRLRDETGKPLPQTEDLPTFDSPSFKRRIDLLFEAIVKDDPKLAASAFFPLIAYEQVKDIRQPERDYKLRLLTAYAQNIHDYHRQLGKTRAQSKLLAVLPSTLAARWMKPGTEGNRLGYFRLLRTRLKVADASGAEHLFEITSMISWRGEWYVVHLNGFK